MRLYRANPYGYDSGSETPQVPQGGFVGYDSGSDARSADTDAGGSMRRRFGHAGVMQAERDARGVTVRAGAYSRPALRPPAPEAAMSVGGGGVGSTVGMLATIAGLAALVLVVRKLKKRRASR